MSRRDAPQSATSRRIQDIVDVNVTSLQPHPDNPRKITRERFDQLKLSLTADPDMLRARPLIALRDGTVIAGNQRLRAAVELGWESVPVVYADVDEQTARVWMLRDNNAFGDWDEQPLAEMLAGLEQGGVELALAGFNSTELDSLLAAAATPRTVDEDDAPAPPATPRSRAGEVYTLGPHAVACGDATDPLLVKRLLGDAAIDLVVTDPPYGVDYEAKAHALESARGQARHRRAEIAGDSAASLRELLAKTFRIAHDLASPGTPIYIWHADTHAPLVRAAYEHAGWLHKQTLIWVKNHLVLGRQDYQWRHEPCAYGWKPGGAHRWYAGLAETTTIDETTDPAKMAKKDLVALVRELQQTAPTSVIHHDKPHASPLHPTMKPVGLIERLIRNSSSHGAIVYDPFAGGGSTMIAADKLGRRCFMVELDPGYCDVIRDRWDAWNAG